MKFLARREWGSWLMLDPIRPGWRLLVFVAAGAALGVGLVAARVARVTSYLSEEPEVCINCHVMNNAYATWMHGSHGKVAVCTDCHLPHTNPVAKLAFKGRDGIRHSTIFALRLEPQVMRLSQGAVPVIQENCLRCHSDKFQMIRLASVTERKCWDCHENMHGSVISLSATPHARRPALPTAGMDWMKKRSEP